MTIAGLKQLAGKVPVAAEVVAQVQARTVRSTKDGKPYVELTFADATGSMGLKIWSDTPLHAAAAAVAENAMLRLDAEWTQNSYGMNANHLKWRELEAAAVADFLAGDPALREKQEMDFAAITGFCELIEDPRLRGLCARFFEEMGARFRRTAAAKKNHHARRGGLVEHVAQMMRTAAAICGIYPELNRDLMIAGVLFHDIGKLWENTYPEDGFSQIHSLHGEMMGHIPLGIELVNRLWRELMETPGAADWGELKPSADETRLHLLHLIASHHGQFEYGSPVLPRTPEAFALHYIDNLDAKLEMLRGVYSHSSQLVPGIYARVFPLPTNLVRSLPRVGEG